MPSPLQSYPKCSHSQLAFDLDCSVSDERHMLMMRISTLLNTATCWRGAAVSLYDEQRDSRPPSRVESELEDQEEEDIPLVALAPDASLLEEQPAGKSAASTGPVFECLDELISSGKVCLTKAVKIKSSYRRLHEHLKRSQDSQLQLLTEAKSRRAELERLQADLEQTEEQSTSEQPQSEVNELRRRLLQAYNELRAAEDREYKTQHKLKRLWEEKQYLERENEIQPKPAELESRTKALQDKHKDLRKEVAERQLEIRSLIEDVEAHKTQILKEQKELEDKNEIIELKEAESVRLISVPEQIRKETERKSSKREAVVKKTEALNTDFSEMELHVKQVEQHNDSLRMRKKMLNEELKCLQAKVEAGQRESRRLLKELVVKREEEAELTGNRGILEMKLQNVMCDRKHLLGSQSVQLKEKNRQMQALKRMEKVLTFSMEQLEHTQCIYSQLQAQLDAVSKRGASNEQRMELQKEVDALRISLEKKLSAAEESRKKQQFGMIQELLRETSCRREELHNLRCLTQIKAEERGQKHRERLKAEQLNQHIEQELQEKALIITDHNKLNTMLQRRISQYCKLCHMIVEEKNKYVRLKEIASQTITELMEQVKVLENEMEIQRTIAINKDRSLTKAHMRISNISKMRDKLQNDISKAAWKHCQISQEFENNKLESIKLTKMMNLQEQALLEINRNQETSIQRRNSLGIQLLEHEEVLFNYYEKVNIQEAAITTGNMVLESLEKEMRDLQLEINEERRQIELKKRKLPLKKKLEEEITVLQIELSEARDKTIECVNRTIGYKVLKGRDPSPADLIKKIEQLEVSLAEREKQVLEKELLVDQVTRLSKPLSERAENCQEDGLSLAKKLNELRAHIINTNHRMMAASAELSMKQAVALALQQEIKEKELKMDRCQQQLEQGLPPCPEIEEEWRRMLRDKRRRQRDKEERERLAEKNEWTQLPNGVYTTAEVRPDAYIPEDDRLPLPKPFGALAPFKPSKPGANMRHFCKPMPNAPETSNYPQIQS